MANWVQLGAFFMAFKAKEGVEAESSLFERAKSDMKGGEHLSLHSFALNTRRFANSILDVFASYSRSN